MTNDKVPTINGIEIGQSMPETRSPPAELFEGQEGCFQMDDGRKVWFKVTKIEGASNEPSPPPSKYRFERDG